MESNSELSVFIAGEVIDLCAPTDDPAVIDRWSRWFNQSSVTTYLAQGLLPNTRIDQEQFLRKALANQDRLIVLMRPKGVSVPVGVASLSTISHVQRQCDMAMVIGEQVSSSDALFFALETKCRLTEHAFEVLGMERINSTQVVDLINWQRWQILFGFQVEGVLRAKFRKGQQRHDVLTSSCLVEDYLKIKQLRGGRLWPGKSQMFELLKRLPSRTLIDEMREWLTLRHEQYWNEIVFTIEESAHGHKAS